MLIFGVEKIRVSLLPWVRMSVTVGDRVYPSLYHWYWARAASTEEGFRRILTSAQGWNPKEIKDTLDNIVPNKVPINIYDWENIKYDVMRVGLIAKLQQHPLVLSSLLSLPEPSYIFHIDEDTFWGIESYQRHGSNYYGKLLNVIRKEILLEGTTAFFVKHNQEKLLEKIVYKTVEV